MMDNAACLFAAQNSDGGWAYVRGASWTEPTAWALLALRAGGLENGNYLRGLRWLRRTQRTDGAWAPEPGLNPGTWVTALGLLVCADRDAGGDCPGACRWVLAASSRGSGFVERLRAFLSDRRPEQGAGWPFFPETAGWVVPTAVSILALARVDRMRHAPAIASRIAAARQFLFDRRCADGGWNHGSSAALGYEAGSYPETTGLALLAMHGSRAPDLGRSVAAAEAHLSRCRSAEGRAWLGLALRAHGRPFEAAGEPACHTVTDHSLTLLARSDAAKDLLTP